MSQTLQSLPGFRDFTPAECAVRNYVFEVWRKTAAAHGFREWEGPTLEATELYRKKSGDEIVGQLFHFEDKGGRAVALRPEVTPTLARVAAARQRDFKKPLKWFQIGACFRYEAPQKGRLREFYQWNADILGETAVAADAELIALVVNALRAFGFTPDDVAVRVSDRQLWNRFFAEADIAAADTAAFLQIIDKWERERPEVIESKLQALGTSRAAVADFIERARADDTGHFAELRANLAARGLDAFLRIDPGIVRGLAYYTGTVFEFFALQHGMRAIAGGGRYDELVSTLSDGAVSMPAVGFGMGDVVLSDLIKATPAAAARLEAWLQREAALEVYVVVADEAKRLEAWSVLQTLRDAGLRTDIALTPAKIGKQFQAAEALQASAAVVVGTEFPTLKVKNLATREETTLPAEDWVEAVRALVQQCRSIA